MQADTEKNKVTEPHVASPRSTIHTVLYGYTFLGAQSADVFYHVNGALRVVREKLSRLTLNYGEL